MTLVNDWWTYRDIALIPDSSFWFGHLSMDGNAVDNLILMPSIWFNSFIISAINCSPLSKIMLFSKLCNFQTLSLNSHAISFALVLSVVGCKSLVFGKRPQA